MSAQDDTSDNSDDEYDDPRVNQFDDPTGFAALAFVPPKYQRKMGAGILIGGAIGLFLFPPAGFIFISLGAVLMIVSYLPRSKPPPYRE
jgi:hypothetical protein